MPEENKMGTQKVRVDMKGKTALLMHKFPMVEIEAIEKKSKEDQAEISAYRDEKSGNLYIPGLNIQRALVAGATYSKGKGRSSLQKQVAACVMVEPEYVDLGIKEYKIDSRPIVVPATKGRIIRHRPRIDDWGASFFVEYDDSLLTEAQLRKVIDDTLERVGLLDFRPEKKGPFGRAMVTKWERVKPD